MRSLIALLAITCLVTSCSRSVEDQYITDLNKKFAELNTHLSILANKGYVDGVESSATMSGSDGTSVLSTHNPRTWAIVDCAVGVSKHFEYVPYPLLDFLKTGSPKVDKWKAQLEQCYDRNLAVTRSHIERIKSLYENNPDSFDYTPPAGDGLGSLMYSYNRNNSTVMVLNDQGHLLFRQFDQLGDVITIVHFEIDPWFSELSKMGKQ